ncbi:SOS response-associated peptidase [Cognatilysobacter lacus]|nr:SOS response-associated peptidase [Lysobacter lacus]
MCGRDTFRATWAEVHAASQPLFVKFPDEEPVPTYNRAPTQRGWTVIADEGGGIVVPMRWGLLPPWAKDTRLAYSTINARLDGITTKPAFRSAWKSRRCLIPTSGYYEWQPVAGGKQPYFIHPANAPVMFFGGLYEARPDGAGGELLTYSVITREADPELAAIHDRMPLILAPETFNEWLHGTPEQAMSIALMTPEAPVAAHPVDRAVGNVRNDRPDLIDPVQLATG